MNFIEYLKEHKSGAALGIVGIISAAFLVYAVRSDFAPVGKAYTDPDQKTATVSNYRHTAKTATPSEAASRKFSTPASSLKEIKASDKYVPSAYLLNLAYFYPEDADTSDAIHSYAGEIFQRLNGLNADYLATYYDMSDRTPLNFATSRGLSPDRVMGKYNPQDSRHDPKNPATWTINNFRNVNVAFYDGDGNRINGYYAVQEIMSLASVYAYYHDMNDAEAMEAYCEELFKNAMSSRVSMGNVYYDSGCLTRTKQDEAAEAIALEAKQLAIEHQLSGATMLSTDGSAAGFDDGAEAAGYGTGSAFDGAANASGADALSGTAGSASGTSGYAVVNSSGAVSGAAGAAAGGAGTDIGTAGNGAATSGAAAAGASGSRIRDVDSNVVVSAGNAGGAAGSAGNAANTGNAGSTGAAAASDSTGSAGNEGAAAGTNGSGDVSTGAAGGSDSGTNAAAASGQDNAGDSAGTGAGADGASSGSDTSYNNNTTSGSSDAVTSRAEEAARNAIASGYAVVGGKDSVTYRPSTSGGSSDSSAAGSGSVTSGGNSTGSGNGSSGSDSSSENVVVTDRSGGVVTSAGSGSADGNGTFDAGSGSAGDAGSSFSSGSQDGVVVSPASSPLNSSSITIHAVRNTIQARLQKFRAIARRSDGFVRMLLGSPLSMLSRDGGSTGTQLLAEENQVVVSPATNTLSGEAASAGGTSGSDSASSAGGSSESGASASAGSLDAGSVTSAGNSGADSAASGGTSASGASSYVTVTANGTVSSPTVTSEPISVSADDGAGENSDHNDTGSGAADDNTAQNNTASGGTASDAAQGSKLYLYDTADMSEEEAAVAAQINEMLRQANVLSGAESYCPGHIDLYISITIKGIDDRNGLFKADTIGNDEANFNDEWQGWTEERMAEARTLNHQDWFETYGLSISSIHLTNELTEDEITEYLDSLPEDISDARKAVVDFALHSVGKVPYYWGGKPAGPGYDVNHFYTLVSGDTHGRILKGLDCSGWVNWVYWSATGASLPGESTGSLIGCGRRIARAGLRPGDIIIRTGADAHVVMFLGWTQSGNFIGIHETGGVKNNVVIEEMTASWPYYRALLE